jgi:biopolymer transport protein ExbD
MSLVASCLSCGSRFAAPVQLAGTTVACPTCGAAIQVPLETPSARQKKKRARWAMPVVPPPPPTGHPDYELPTEQHGEPPAPPPVVGAAKPAPAGEHPLLLFPTRAKHEEDLIDMTAMVDIVFFLLIFFLVTSMQSLEAVIDMPPPRSEKGVSTKNVRPVDYRNDPDYMVAVIDEENNVWLDDEIVSGEPALRAMLRSSAGADGKRKGLLIVGSADATHGKLVMVLDAAADAGVSELLFTVTEDPDAL